MAQHSSVIAVDVDVENHLLSVGQNLVYYNETRDTIATLVLNDWNNAYSAKDTPLAKRFSDEFVRSFHYAKDAERGFTTDLKITDIQLLEIDWHRSEKHPDIIEIPLPEPLYPGETATIFLSYFIKVPSDKFTGFGFDKNGAMNLRNWFLTPARFENGNHIKYSNLNLDDAANASVNLNLTVNLPSNFEVFSDLQMMDCIINDDKKSCNLSGSARREFSLYITPKKSFESFINSKVEVLNSIEAKRVENIQKAIVVDRVVNFLDETLGKYPHEKITVSQADYERSPFYGLNQLPSFINVFSDDFIYELKFLKTYTNNYLKNTLTADQRKDNWVYDAIQVYVMMRYIDEFYPHMKMAGGLSKVGLLRKFNFVNSDFNDQYSVLWLLMARKNLDQPAGDPQHKLIRFNEQIATKYYSGLALDYLDSYLANGIVAKSISEFIALNNYKQTSESDFEAILKGNSAQNIDWFFETMIDSRKIVDYTFGNVEKSDDKITATIINRTDAKVPVPLYAIKGSQVVSQHWIEGFAKDTTITFARNGADRLVLNHQNEVPEYNRRNNYHSLKSFKIGNKPLRFTFFKDLEDPAYNQILYVPTLLYNLYDGLTPGLRFYNKTLLDKPFIYDVNPMYSPNTQSLTGQLSFTINQNFRNSKLYNARFSTTGSYFHYAPDAGYTRVNPTLLLRIRPSDFRNNRKQVIMLRDVIVHREDSRFIVEDSENYSVFNARYSNSNAEITGLLAFNVDFQAAAKFGKTSAEMQFRRLFHDNRQLSLRVYAGTFLYNRTNNDFFSFALDRPTDYLFDYNYYGRSEADGLFSQQLIVAEGGFKSKLDTPFANQWISTFNASYGIWNWIEAYGDVGFVKNRHTDAKFVYDSGIRLNLVPDYFELYFPVYSNNGWEITEKNYAERIRFIVTLSPSTLISLFTRKWF